MGNTAFCPQRKSSKDIVIVENEERPVVISEEKDTSRCEISSDEQKPPAVGMGALDPEWRRIGEVSQLITRRCHRVYAQAGESKDLVLFAVDNQFYAMSTWCSHMGGPLYSGDIEDYNGEKCVRCPWHGYLFKLETGSNPQKPLRQRIVDTKVVAGDVYIHYPDSELSLVPYPSDTA